MDENVGSIANGSLVDDGWRRIRHRGDRCWGWNKFSSWNNQTYNSFVSQKSFQFYFSTLNWVTTELIDSLFDRATSYFLRSFVLEKERGRKGRKERREKRRGEFSCDTREKRNTRTRANTARVLFARVTSSYVSATKNNGRRWGTKGTFRKHSRNNRVNADRSYASLATPFIHRLSCLSPFATHGFEREKGRNSWVENSWCWNTGSWILSKSTSLRKVFLCR